MCEKLLSRRQQRGLDLEGFLQLEPASRTGILEDQLDLARIDELFREN
jgi:hypothetical protein